MSFVIAMASVLGSLVLLVLLFMFGQGVIESLLAILRHLVTGIAKLFGVLFGSLLRLGWYFAGFLIILAIGASWLAYLYWIKPGEFHLLQYRPPACTELLDRNGATLDYLCPFEGIRILKPISGFSEHLKTLVVMLEDDKFYEHEGFDLDEIWNSIEKDLETKKLARGGSTITQQLAKNLFLSKEKSFFRKASEIPLAIRLEKELSKDQILELYLNTIEWGPGIYGAEAASRLYFDHEASALTQEESWLLALMIPNPKELNLWIAPKAKKSILRRATQLAKRLYIEHRMNKDEAKAALGQFETFLNKWMQAGKPTKILGQRKYPARWNYSQGFALSDIVSIKRAGNNILRRFKHAPIKSYLDRELQEKLESKFEGLSSGTRISTFADVIALTEDEKIRAITPIPNKSALTEVQAMAQELGLKATILPARAVPHTQLWP